MRRSDQTKPIRMQQIRAYTYRGVDVFRSWIVIPTEVVQKLKLQKGEELSWSIVGNGILFTKNNPIEEILEEEQIEENIETITEITQGVSGNASDQTQILSDEPEPSGGFIQ